MASQKVFVFPRLSEFDPNRIPLIMRSRDPEIAVSWLLGFVDLVCGADFEASNISFVDPGIVEWDKPVKYGDIKYGRKIC
ncbi:hypothetical protein MTO96_032490 [Rhipicephalus appendiculatus]